MAEGKKNHKLKSLSGIMTFKLPWPKPIRKRFLPEKSSSHSETRLLLYLKLIPNWRFLYEYASSP